MWRTFLPVLLLVTHYPFSTALFTVEMAKTLYLAEFGNTVKMECRFPTGGSLDSINVYWHRMLSNGSEYEVYTLLNGNQDLQSQHPEYKGRVHMKPDLLRKGRAELEISNVKISDSGSYRCLIKMGGADYKQATLSVKASYRNIETKVTNKLSASGRYIGLRCQAEGFPLAEVIWRDGKGHPLSAANTTHGVSADGLYIVTSVIKLNTSYNENYTCTFRNDTVNENSSAFLYVADLMETDESEDAVAGSIFLWSLLTAFVICGLVAFIYIRFWKKSKFKCLHSKGPAGGAEEHLQRVTVFTELNVGIKKESGRLTRSGAVTKGQHQTGTTLHLCHD
ncbi:programmed cell death 1 ligand 1-like isoform X1 [Acipenser ruthenus]|uniref:programmed cell death 1 ligand 1-like isoform X1 n=1 Tax=Acipenser ruthenus TaxID=7906 RepID=UPI00145BDF0C|nr:programmed cell death 1 ligand 1-like isoform X1 [Acipenser ruthenus]XP_033870051.3 programmed cell death 1 ligand 1-like isoform X1 [Acipenser ruthenus]